MGVYIPNMSKPKDCYLCEFTNGYECWSNGEPWFDVEEAYAKRTLSPNCPLIEISETKYHNMVVALDILEHEQNDCIEAERRADDVRHNEQQDF